MTTTENRLDIAELEINRRQSRESIAFFAVMLWNGERVADVWNEGDGDDCFFQWGSDAETLAPLREQLEPVIDAHVRSIFPEIDSRACAISYALALLVAQADDAGMAIDGKDW